MLTRTTRTASNLRESKVSNGYHVKTPQISPQATPQGKRGPDEWSQTVWQMTLCIDQ